MNTRIHRTNYFQSQIVCSYEFHPYVCIVKTGEEEEKKKKEEKGGGGRGRCFYVRSFNCVRRVSGLRRGGGQAVPLYFICHC